MYYYTKIVYRYEIWWDLKRENDIVNWYLVCGDIKLKGKYAWWLNKKTLVRNLQFFNSNRTLVLKNIKSQI